MKDDAKPANAMTELPPETRTFLARLSRDDLDALERFIPLIKRLLAFGVVARWLALFIIAIVVGFSTLWDSVTAILKHFRTP